MLTPVLNACLTLGGQDAAEAIRPKQAARNRGRGRIAGLQPKQQARACGRPRRLRSFRQISKVRMRVSRAAWP